MSPRQIAVRVLMVMLFCFFSLPAEAAPRAHGRAKTVQVNKRKKPTHKKRHGRGKTVKPGGKRHHAKGKRHHH
jgi:hypothetical protein